MTHRETPETEARAYGEPAGSAHERKGHDLVEATKYALGDLDENEKLALEKHLATCKDCTGHVSFVNEFNQGLKEAKPDLRAPGEPHPDASLVVALEEGELDQRNKKTAEHVRAHMIFCRACQEAYQALKQMRRETEGEPSRFGEGPDAQQEGL